MQIGRDGGTSLARAPIVWPVPSSKRRDLSTKPKLCGQRAIRDQAATSVKRAHREEAGGRLTGHSAHTSCA